jgi:hypothetical protein
MSPTRWRSPSPPLEEYLFSVTQISNLLYRRFPIGRASYRSNARERSQGPQAGSPAIQQIGNLRYFAAAWR